MLLLVVAALAAPAPGSAAAPPPPVGLPGVTGPRALAFPVTVAVGGGNDALYVNPAAIAARRRYSVDTLFFLDRRADTNVGMYFGASVVDSTGSVAAGATYDRAQEGTYTGNLWRLALASQLSEGLFVGATAVYDNLNGPRPVLAVTADAGFLWQAAKYFSIGGAGYNLIPIGNEAVAPLGAAAGLAVGSDTGFQIGGEWRAMFPKTAPAVNQYSGGIELLLGDMFPVRGGYVYQQATRTSWWTAGVGFVTKNVGLDAGYQQSFEDPNARTFVVALRVFPLQ
jgi:hypothetical protein